MSSVAKPETGEPIDLEALKSSAFSDNDADAVVEREWLKRVYQEISAAREAHRRLGQVFGKRGI